MNLAELSIKRPIFITCIIILMLAVGSLSFKKLGVDLFPDVTFPVVIVNTIYPGAGPVEIETLISKPIEEELSTIGGVKRLTSVSFEGYSRVIAEFSLETDIKYAESQVRDHVSTAKTRLPTDAKDPIIRRVDPADQPILVLGVDGALPQAKLFDIADDVIRPKLEQVNQVGLVEVFGGRKREIHVALDRRKLKASETAVSLVANKLGSTGENVPGGKVDRGTQATVFRTVGEFKTLKDIQEAVINFYGNDVPTTVGDFGSVIDTLQDEASRAYVNGKRALQISAFKQSGANTIAVTENLKKRVAKMNTELALLEGKPQITIIRDGSVPIRLNVDDVKESIVIGVILAVVVVYFFLANGRSTIITGLALPNSMIGAFILMAFAGFTVNIMTLLALSLSVGLLVDDAIVVRENIFRHIEMGKDPKTAALEGTNEVRLAVIATTLTVIAVFGPVAFLSGVVGQFFKQFGLTICFAMLISLFDALTIAPMLSAYFAVKQTHGKINTTGLWGGTVGRLVKKFDTFQNWLEDKYVAILNVSIKRPLMVLGVSFLIFIGSCGSIVFVPKTFLPTQDTGEFSVSLEMPQGTNLETTDAMAQKVDAMMRQNSEIEIASLSVGGKQGESEVADFYIHLVPRKQRSLNTSGFKEKLREQLKQFAEAKPIVKDFDPVGAGTRPFTLNLIGLNQVELETAAKLVYARLATLPGLKDVTTTLKEGKPEFQAKLDPSRSKQLGVNSKTVGIELRAQVEGLTAAKFREGGREYDVRVRLQADQRDLKAGFRETYVPNMNYNLVRLSDVAEPVEAVGPATVNRQDRGRYIQIAADIAAGAGLGDIMSQIEKILKEEIKLPPGVRFAFVGQAENFQELISSMITALGLGVLFIFLVLASLYESFVTPLTIMLALPLAACGSLVALAITRESLNIFSMIGMILLFGIATKNSILLVDYANQLIQGGMGRAEALIKSGKTRLRPILMTTFALIAGTLPIALGLNEASKQRTSMGVAIIGGMISSTLLTLVVVPAAFSYIDRFRIWSAAKLKAIFAAH